MDKGVLGWLLVPALVLAAVFGWICFKQRDLMYFPQFTRAVPPADFELAVDGAVLRGWVVNPGRPDAIIYFGGNAEPVQGMRGDLAQWFPDRSSYLVPYRGFGASSGEPTEAALSADALALFDHVRTRHRDGSISVIGRSLGGGVASHLAAHRPVDKLVLVTPFDSMVGVAQAHYPWLPVRRLLWDRYDSVAHLQAYRGPVLVIRASDDQVVPASSTDRLVAALGARAEAVTLPDSDHNTLSARSGYRRAIIAFVDAPAPSAATPAD